MAKESAASRAAKIQRQHQAGRAATGIHTFKHLGVTVWGGKVYKGSGLLRDELGSLAGACAGVLETRRVSQMAGLFTGVAPWSVRAFVQGGGGNMRRKEIKFAGHVPQLQQEIADFNSLADAAGSPREAQAGRRYDQFSEDEHERARRAGEVAMAKMAGVKVRVVNGTMIMRGPRCPKGKQHAVLADALRCPGGNACTGE